MAGSWQHMTTKQGKLRNNESFNVMIENGGDAYEAAEECFGMVWWLARGLAECRGPGTPDRDDILEVVLQAKANYEAGLKIGGRQRER